MKSIIHHCCWVIIEENKKGEKPTLNTFCDQKLSNNFDFYNIHGVKSVRIWSYSGPYFPAFGLNAKDTSYLSVFSPNAGKHGLE